MSYLQSHEPTVKIEPNKLKQQIERSSTSQSTDEGLPWLPCLNDKKRQMHSERVRVEKTVGAAWPSIKTYRHAST
jgi:hypothetical protein